MVTNQPHTLTTKSLRRQGLVNWFATTIGQGLLQMELTQISKALNNLFGYHIVQLGNLNNLNLMAASRISHKVVIDFYTDNSPESITNMVCESDALALGTESMDVVLMPHILEFETDPHRVLREADRVLIGEGHLVIVGFNPWSLWGLWRRFLAWSDKSPWHGRFIGVSRIQDWLSLLDFEVVEIEHDYYRPPLKKPALMRRLQFMEKLGRKVFPMLGGIYIIVAKKRVWPVTPVKLQWKQRRKLIAAGIIEPSSRLSNKYQVDNDG